MDTAPARTPAFQRAVFEDALGTRHHADAPGGEPLEVLELRDDFGTDAFESALRDRVAALASFQTTCFSHVRSVQRNHQSAAKLFVVSDRVAGARLSNVLARTRQQLDVNATLCVIRQLVAAIALLHEKMPGVAHGAISPEHIVITPKARLVVVDHVFGPALEQLRYSPDRYWQELHAPLPRTSEPTFDQRTDVLQIGIIALELILGRRIERNEYPDRVAELAERAWTSAAADVGKSLPSDLRAWLLRMLQLDSEQAFSSAVDAWADLEYVLLGSSNVASFAALESVMAEYKQKTPDSGVVTRPSVTPPSSAAAPSQPAVVAKTATPPVATTPAVNTPAVNTPPVSTPPPVITTPPAITTPVTATIAEAPPASSPSVAPPAASSPSAAKPAAEPRVAEVALPFAEASATPLASTQEDTGLNKPMARGSRRWIAAAAVFILLASGGALFGRKYLVPSAAAEAPGTLVVTTNPAGFQVFIDGQPRGVTPLTLELAAGSHEMKLATEGEPRIIPITITAGSTVAQTLELPKSAPRTGQLTVRTEPPGARVSIDGTPSGTSPLTIEGLTPGTHRVALETDLSSLTQEVTIEPGTTASLVVPMTAPQGVPVSGWISVSAPAEVQVYEGGRLLGTSQTDRLMVSAGRHDLEIVNEALGYRTSKSVTVTPGKVSAIRLDWPNGSMSLNAQPWADVWVAGERIGETPIGNISVPIGTHEIVFRHPQLGEQVVRTTVTATTPARVIVDMRKR